MLFKRKLPINSTRFGCWQKLFLFLGTGTLCHVYLVSFPLLCADCEHLIRRMLVLDPSKRLSIGQIKEHKWMVMEVPVQRPMLYQQTAEGEAGVGEYSEQVLRLMHSLGIDQHKTVEVRNYTNFKK